MAREKNTILDDVKNLVQERANFFVGFITILVLLTGITIINNPSKWWISVLSVSIIFVSLLIFLNARILIKVSLSFILIILTAAATFKIGSMIDTTGNSGFLWMMTILTTFFLQLFLSYILSSTNGRWGATTISMLFGTFITFMCVMIAIPFNIAIIIGFILSLATFLIWYKFGSRQSYKIEKMPEIFLNNDTIEDLIFAAKDKGYGVYIPQKHYKPYIMIWDNESAYIITGIDMNQKIGAGGRRGNQLVYDGQNINPWLLNLIQRITPNNTKNSHLMLILLDFNNKNGATSKVIGVQPIDSNKRIPVGILPAKELLNSPNKLLTRIKEEFDDYVIKLFPKQVKHLNKNFNNVEENTQEELTTVEKSGDENLLKSN